MVESLAVARLAIVIAIIGAMGIIDPQFRFTVCAERKKPVITGFAVALPVIARAEIINGDIISAALAGYE
jgi:hypothetical protein